MELTAENLACRRGGRRIFDGVSFTVGPGQAATLRGPNGSGKSSLLRVLAGFAPAEAGSARMGETSLVGTPDAWREQVALAGHLDAVKSALTVRENLDFWAALDGSGGDAEAALDRFGLTRIADDPAQFCSAGQRRRLGLARLLVARRALWLLDEPTVSLDVEFSARFEEIVADHCATGGSAIAATHVPLDLPEGPEIRLSGTVAADPVAEDWL